MFGVGSTDKSIEEGPDIAIVMAKILGTMMAFLVGLVVIQTPSSSPSSSTTKRGQSSQSSFLPSAKKEPSKRAYELFNLTYSVVWILSFGAIVVFQLYESFDEWAYLHVCGGLMLPYVLQPIVFPSASYNSPDQNRPLLERYSFKANLWLLIYSFIGNYWYTHYFYSVLKAQYTMPAHRLNNVPIAMFLATHFYFSMYHGLSNAVLRKIVTAYQPGMKRNALYVSVVFVFSYFTAFMETLTISSYPYYSFEDRNMAYTVGSAFYGIYFLVSFPGFFRFDTEIDQKKGRKVTVMDTVIDACGHGMLILCLLDFVRLYLGVPLVVGISPTACSV